MLWDREISKNVDIVRNQGYQLGRRRTKIWNGKSWGRTLWFWIEIGDSHIKKLLTSPSSATACCTSQFRSVAQSCSTLCDPMDCSKPSFPVHHQLLELAQTHVHWVGDALQHLILCRPLLLLPSIFPSIGIFSNESVLHIRWPKYWSFSFSISPSNEYSGLIFFRMDWFDLLAVQGTLKSLLQQFKSISSLPLSFLYSPTITSIHDYWKNHSFD